MTSDMENNKIDKVHNLKNTIIEASNISKKNKEIVDIDSAFEEERFEFLTDYLYNNRYSVEKKKQEILELFSDKNYCLPDLSKTLDYYKWAYCHEIARFVAGNKTHEENFIRVLDKQCSKNTSKCLRERCNALVYYNFKICKHKFD